MKKLLWLLFLLGCTGSDRVVGVKSDNIKSSVGTYLESSLALPPIEHIMVSKTLQLVYMFKGSPISGNLVTWASSDSTIVNVSSSGLVSTLTPQQYAASLSNDIKYAIVTGTYKNQTSSSVIIVTWPYMLRTAQNTNCSGEDSTRTCIIIVDFTVTQDSLGTVIVPNWTGDYFTFTGFFVDGQQDGAFVSDGSGHIELTITETLPRGSSYLINVCSSANTQNEFIATTSGQSVNHIHNPPCWSIPITTE